MQDHFINKLLGLKDISVTDVKNFNTSIEIYISTRPQQTICPCCGNTTSKIHDYRQQIIKDIPYQFKAVYIILKKRRYVCSCGKRFDEQYDFLPRYHRMTTRLVYFLVEQLRYLQSLKAIAQASFLSTAAVIRIFEHLNYPKPSIPQVLSIDKFKGNAETGKFQCILVDAKKKKVLDILPDRTYAHLSDYFRQIPKDERLRVRFFICDMCKPFVSVARTFFPNAKIIIDRFHFIRYITWALENVRKRLQKTMPTHLRKYYKRSKRLLPASYEKLSDENKSALDLMLLYNDDLRLVHSLKEAFFKLCRQPKYSIKRELFADWISRADASGLKEFQSCAKTYRNWYKEILNAFKYNYSNGPTEGFNNKIKVLKRISFGLKNFNRFRTRILHINS